MSVKGTGTVRTETEAAIYTNTSNLISGDDVQEAIVNALDSLSKDTYVDTIPYEIGESVIFDDGSTKKIYVCVAGTTPGESPSTHPAKWTDILETVLGGDVTIGGNLIVEGDTVVNKTENVLISDNHLYLNNGYKTTSAQTGGLVVNYLPTATTDTIDTGGFTAGVAATSNPTAATVGAATFSVGDFIQIDGADDPSNNGLFEVLSHAANVLTIRGIGTTARVEDFTQNQFVTDTTVSGTITKVNVSVLRAGTDGAWETANGSSTGLTFSDFRTVDDNSLTLSGYLSGKKKFDWKLNFTPPTTTYTGGQSYGSGLVETEKYILTVIPDTFEAEYKYHQLIRYNKHTGRIDTFRITTTNAYSGDHHKLAAMLLTSSGTLLVAIEQLPGDSNHNGPIDIFRYADLDNITSDIAATATIGDNLDMRLSYPFLFELSNGDVFLESRRRFSTTDYSRRIYSKSSDDGATWAAATEYANYGDADYWLYSSVVMNNVKDRSEVIIALTPGYTPSTYGSVYQYITFVKTSDFLTFYALDGTNLGSTIDSTEMDTHLSWGNATTSSDMYFSRDLKIIGDEIVFLGQIGTRDAGGTDIPNLQIVKVNIDTGIVTSGSLFTNNLVTSGFIKMYPFDLGGELHFMGLFENKLKIYKAASSLDSLTKVDTVGLNYYNIYGNNLYRDNLLMYYNQDTLSIEIYEL